MTVAAVGWPTNRVFTGWAAADTIVGTIAIIATRISNVGRPSRRCWKSAHAKASAGRIAVAAMGRLSATGACGVRTIITNLARIRTGGAITTSAVAAAYTSAIRIACTAGSCESIIADLIAFNDAIAAGRCRAGIWGAILRVFNTSTARTIKSHRVVGCRGATAIRRFWRRQIHAARESIAHIWIINKTVRTWCARIIGVEGGTTTQIIPIPPIVPAIPALAVTVAGARHIIGQFLTGIQTRCGTGVVQTVTTIRTTGFTGIVHTLAANAAVGHDIKGIGRTFLVKAFTRIRSRIVIVAIAAF